MSETTKVSMVDVLAALRGRLLKAIGDKDQDELVNLKIAFSMLVEASYEKHNSTATKILVALEDAARDGAMGDSWKSDIPTLEAIEMVFAA